MKQKLFQVAMLLHPTTESLEKGGQSELIMAPTNILAADAEEAKLKAVLQIGPAHSPFLYRIEILVRNF